MARRRTLHEALSLPPAGGDPCALGAVQRPARTPLFDEFLREAAVFEQLNSAEHAGIAIDLPEARLKRVRYRCSRCCHGRRGHGRRARRRSTQAPTRSPGGDGSDRVFQFHVAALDAEGLAPFSAIVSDWDYLSERDGT